MPVIIREKPHTLLCAVRETPVPFEKVQEDEPEADVLSFEECKPEGMQGKLNASNCSRPRVPDWPENWMPVIVRDPVHALKLSFMKGDEPEADGLRRVSKRCHRKIADSDDDMEDSVPDLIDDEISTVQDKVQILGIEFHHDASYINRPISYHPMIIDVAPVYTGYQRVQKQLPYYGANRQDFVIAKVDVT